MSKKSKKKKKDNLLGSATVARNRKASFDFHLGKEFVAGIVLQGTEVKSVRNGQVQLKGAYAKVIDGEVFLFNCHIAEYAFGNRYNHEPLRAKKLLLNKDEISKLEQKIKLNKQTLVASKIFFKRNYAKVLLHLAEGKQKGDKREAIKKKDMQRELARDASNWA